MPHPLYAITIGDPAGIGPEILLKSLARLSAKEQGDWAIYADHWILKHWAARLQLPLPGCTCVPLNIEKKSLDDPHFAATIAHQSLLRVSKDLNEKKVAGVVTAPVSKARLKAIGFTHPGHTEFFATESQSEAVRMMFVGDTMKVILETIHVPIREVPDLLSRAHFRQTLTLAKRVLTDSFGIVSPKIAVCGLNPHAGEDGLLGREEIEILNPVIAEFTGVFGPFPSDAYFGARHFERYDATIALYHDQGLIPFKMRHFDDGVNLTIGLPYIRTSPDHGPAFDIAGQGIANDASFFAAMTLLKRLGTKGRGRE